MKAEAESAKEWQKGGGRGKSISKSTYEQYAKFAKMQADEHSPGRLPLMFKSAASFKTHAEFYRYYSQPAYGNFAALKSIAENFSGGQFLKIRFKDVHRVQANHYQRALSYGSYIDKVAAAALAEDQSKSLADHIEVAIGTVAKICQDEKKTLVTLLSSGGRWPQMRSDAGFPGRKGKKRTSDEANLDHGDGDGN